MDLISYLNLCLNHLYLFTIKYVQIAIPRNGMYASLGKAKSGKTRSKDSKNRRLYSILHIPIKPPLYFIYLI